jgi:putative nucleotidyltransferase with HDIG domain
MSSWLKSLLASFFPPKTVDESPRSSALPTPVVPARGHVRWRGAAERRKGDRRTEERRVSEAVKTSASGPTAMPRVSDPKDPTSDFDPPRVDLPELPEPLRGSGLDAPATVEQSLLARQRQIVERIGERVANGKFELPHLPSTSMVVMDLAANPSSEISEIVQSLSTDPVLSTRLLRLANSALYATQQPVETLHEAVMRVGMRELRSLIFALSMRQVVFRTQHLTTYAEETWRQSYSVGVVARAIGPKLGMEGDKAFLIGLLHDVGKISLLAMMQREIENAHDASPALVGRVFLQFHEAAGAAMAEGWKLSEEFVSVAGCHHKYEDNEHYARSAALVSLAHRIDLNLSIGDHRYWTTSHYPQFEFLQVPEAVQHEILHAAHAAFIANTEDSAAAA